MMNRVHKPNDPECEDLVGKLSSHYGRLLGKHISIGCWLVSKLYIQFVRSCNKSLADHSGRTFEGMKCLHPLKTGVVGSNPTKDINVCVCLFCECARVRECARARVCVCVCVCVCK
jgi:hypothetical protein